MSYLTSTFLSNMEDEKEKELLENLTNDFKDMFPDRCSRLGEESLNIFLKHQQDRAIHYQYHYYNDLKRYAIISFYLGTYFEEDIFYPWAKKILLEESSFGVKVDKLIVCFQKIIDEVLHDDLNFYTQAMKNLLKVNVEDIKRFKTSNDLINTLLKAYPQRDNAQNREVLERVIREQNNILTQHNLLSIENLYTNTMLIFMFGSFAVNDPLYNWVRTEIMNEPNTSKNKSLALFEKGCGWISKELREIEKLKGDDNNV